MKNLKIKFYIASNGLIFDEFEPIHLDSLLASVLAMEKGLTPPARNEQPEDIKLPVKRSNINGCKIWHASALFVHGNMAEDTRFIRKRFRSERINNTQGTANVRSGKYRSWNIPMEVTMSDYVYAYACGNREDMEGIIKQVKYIGRKRALGFGKVQSYSIEEIEADYSLVKDGKAMRWLPDNNGVRFVRTTPPYWHPINRVNCCDVGDEYQL